jgi:putative spermidine/putrescine transport system permease protein
MLEFRNGVYQAVVIVLAIAAMVLLVAPTVVVVVMSFTGDFTLRFPPRSWSVRWYTELFQNSPQIVAAAWVSLKVAVIATVVSVVLGTLAAVSIAGRRERWAVALDSIFMSPMVFPAMSLGLALLLVLSLAGIRLSTWTLALGHVVIATPFVIRMVSAAAQQVNPALLDCAASLGASRLHVFLTITLPLIRSGVIAGGVVAFLSSIDHVPVSLMLSDPRTETLPIHLWTILEANLDVRVASVSGIVVAATIVVILLLDRRMFVERGRT